MDEHKILTTSFRIPAGLKKRLKMAAAASDTDITAVIRSAVEAWVGKVERNSGNTADNSAGNLVPADDTMISARGRATASASTPRYFTADLVRLREGLRASLGLTEEMIAYAEGTVHPRKTQTATDFPGKGIEEIHRRSRDYEQAHAAEEKNLPRSPDSSGRGRGVKKSADSKRGRSR